MNTIGLVLAFFGVALAIFFSIACNVRDRPLPLYWLAVGPLVAWLGAVLVLSERYF
jgi:hypothetical protein